VPVPVVNFLRLASAAESDDPLRDVGFLQNDLVGCRRSISAVGSTEAEILVLRQQIVVLRRGKATRLRFSAVDRVVPVVNLIRLAID
jgi:hypothetical protein